MDSDIDMAHILVNENGYRPCRDAQQMEPRGLTVPSGHRRIANASTPDHAPAGQGHPGDRPRPRAVRLEIGSGEHPADGYHVRVDILALPAVDVVCGMDRLPFADATFDALGANHVLEHQSWELVDATLAEWVRVLRPGAPIDIGVPDARCRAASWLAGEIDTSEANYWILGGHSDRGAHQGVDGRGVPRWIWNAHHTLFDPESLHALLARRGLADIVVRPEDVCNMRALARKPP